MRHDARLAWLGLTPEPERELPIAVATLRAQVTKPRPGAATRRARAADAGAGAGAGVRGGGGAGVGGGAPDADTTRSAHAADAGAGVPDAVAAEAERIENLILHGTQRSWLRYLGEVTDLVTGAVATGADDVSALHAAETVLDHHRMLIGLPGTGYDRTAPQRSALTDAVNTLRSRGDAR